MSKEYHKIMKSLREALSVTKENVQMIKIKKNKVEAITFSTVEEMFEELNRPAETLKEKIEWKIWKVQSFFKDLISIPRQIYYGIHNLIVWFPVIWNDSQWDYCYMLEIMIKKMQLMEDFFNSDNAYSQDAKLYAEEIKKAKEELIYINDNQYETGVLDEDNKAIVENIGKYVEEVEKRYDKHMGNFCKIFKKELRGWWD